MVFHRSLGTPPSGFSEQRNIVGDSCPGALPSGDSEQRMIVFHRTLGLIMKSERG